MNIFDIVGPIMIGPSSSHTAGAVRIGQMARVILDDEPVKAEIYLHGSFAETYRGHGTDRALLGGLMGMNPDDARIRDAIELATELGLEFKFIPTNLGDVHPNTAKMVLEGKNGNKVVIVGSSVGGGNILITKIDNFPVELTGNYHTLIVPHDDQPGSIAAVSALLAHVQVNIAQMRVFREIRGSQAMMVIETDEPIPKEVVTAINAMPKIHNVALIKPL